MKRFGVLFKKEFMHGAIMIKVMMYIFAVGYGLMFGFLSRLSEYMFAIILGMMPLIIAMSGAPQILQSLSSDKHERTGEMVLTTGVSLPVYILSKLFSGIIHTIIAVFLFYTIFLFTANKMHTVGVKPSDLFYAIFMSIVISIFFCCISIMIRLTKVVHKLIMATFLFIVAVAVIMVIVNSVVKIAFFDAIPAGILWLALFLYGVFCMYIGMKLLAVRDFVAK